MLNIVHPCRALAASLSVLLACAAGTSAQVQSRDGAFAGLAADEFPRQVENGPANVRPMYRSAWTVNVAALEAALSAAPVEFSPEAEAQPLILEVPMPDGTLKTFAVVNSPVMHPELAAKHPEITTYQAYGVDDPAMSGRLDLTPLGFHAMIFTSEGTIYVNPYNRGDASFAASYWRKDSIPHDQAFECHTEDHAGEPPAEAGAGEPGAARSAGTRRTYRLAMATTAEFTAQNGGAAATTAAIVTAANRLSGVYDKDFCIRLQLIANNNLLIFTDTATDGYSNGAASTMLSQNQTNLTNIIGSANYDVGHVIGTASTPNGVAGAIGNVCSSTGKGQGVSLITTGQVLDDAFTLDYPAHELGHQFGGRHLHNSCSGSQGDSSALAVEPGSGSTIMSYAGICPISNPSGGDNIQPHNDDYFNAINIDQIITYSTSGNGSTCGTTAATGNSAPTVSAGADYTIPHSTPYILTATGSDPNGHALTYCWEQADGGPVRTLTTQTVSAMAQGPLVRSRLPVASPTRQFPPQTNLVNNTTDAKDLLPNGARTMNFRVTARDNLGGVWDDAMVLTVASTGPFQVTSPNTAVSWSGTQTVTWNVASTNVAPVNTASVRILLSTDGGATFPTVLSAGTPNDGSELIVLPNVASSTARIKVDAVGNIFFDISNANFTVSSAAPTVNLALSGHAESDAVANGNNNTRVEPGETNISVTTTLVNNGTLGATGVSGTLSSLTPTASILAGTQTQPFPDLGALGGAGGNSAPFILQVDPSHPCGEPITLRLAASHSGGGPQNFDFSVPTGQGGGVGAQTTFSYTGPAVPIPDNTGVPAVITLNVSGLTGTIADVDFRIDGTACSTAAGNTTVGLSHTWVGDLVATLQSPAATSVTIMNRPGSGTTGSGGNHFCQTLFDDAAGATIESIVSGNAPHTGSWRPDGLLSDFNGQDPNGTWTFTVQDFFTQDSGTVRFFSILIRTSNPATCEPPLPGGGACNLADITDIGDSGSGPDGLLTLDDILLFIDLYNDGAGCPGTPPCNGADITDIGDTGGGPDGLLTLDDILLFIDAYNGGCP